MTTTITEAAILETLRQVIDPELGCNIVDLGLVYSVTITDAKVAVVMTSPHPVAQCMKAFVGVRRMHCAVPGVKPPKSSNWDRRGILQ
jgi:metal-sulfur cluster biosynthetic enzyme